MPTKIDMTGWVMSEHGLADSRITVIKEVEPYFTSGGNRQIQYLCQCTCGKQFVALGAKLRKGSVKSCGCLKSQKCTEKNILNGRQIQMGDKFGHLTVIKDLGMKKQKSRNKNWRWSLCQCDCGSEPVEVPNALLINGHKISCGCICSIGEDTIKKILQDNQIQFIQEYSFSDLLSKFNRPYRFDFAIFNNDKLEYLIEFDGKQHYSGPEGVWKNARTLEEIQETDKIKNEYCKKHGYILKRIPYFLIKEINIENIQSNKFNIK